MSSNRITAGEASALASGLTDHDKEYIIDQVYRSVRASLNDGTIQVIFDKKITSNLAMEAAILHLRGDGYKVTLGGLEPTADYLKLDVTWPTK
ncbi:hypothetical protein MER45_07095 [Acinetobacter baumannii]|uniref:hypothetical protein n=1 Tax=Acinetobacter baumannii TaxID=470 RepID=UPI001EE8126A|nr:hypothetical protein [Acinetobacter baumannii]MCG5955838.1 hypothetical protein [Acinetobacter baumannii]